MAWMRFSTGVGKCVEKCGNRVAFVGKTLRKSASQSLPKKKRICSKSANRCASLPPKGTFRRLRAETSAKQNFRHLRCLATQRPTALDPWELFAKQKFPVALPPAAILRKGNALCALAKTLAKLTKAVALVYSLQKPSSFLPRGRGLGDYFCRFDAPE